jgi:hypothetical protein
VNEENAQEFLHEKKPVGFVMRLGYEDVLHIAWSNKKGKVVVYIS